MGHEVARFKRVLHVRAVERDITQTELAGRLREEGAIIGRISDMEEERDNALNDFCANRSRTVSPQELWLERQGIDLIERKLSNDRKELDACRSRIEESRTELVSRHQNVQLMERYVDKLKARADKEIVDAEQKNLDDITSMRFCRNMRRDASR